MSMFSKLLITTVLLAQPTFVSAADELLNGGDVIECPGYEVPSYHSLDLYEGEEVYGLKRTDFNSFTDYKAIVIQVLKRMEKVDPVRAKNYRLVLNNFEKESKIVVGEFGNVRDEGFLAIPEGCSLKQAAVQFRTHTPEGIKYVFNLGLWNKMSAPTKAALVLHELIYREALGSQNIKTSTRVRYFNAFLHSSKMDNIDYITYAQSAGFLDFKIESPKN
ncbi:hypothetical protein ACLVWU_15335 [Bdellovibrio sp. HCB290]|uniref:hypothetical protein n=1 Tax=Bdellovibrio sp. HCB290 TaxID=3394356 RepID=UPI0039B44A16